MKPFEFKIPEFSEFNKEYQKVQETMKQFSEKVQEAMAPGAEQMRKFAKIMAEHTRKISEVMAPVKEHMRKISEATASVAKRIIELPDKTKRVLKNLAEKGWFLPLDITIPAVDHLAKLIESNDDEEIDRSLIEFYTEQLDELLNNLVATLPERAHLFRAAFKAHNHREYDLSIPVLLAQADGVCYDMLGEKLFSRGRKKGQKNSPPRTKKALERKIGSIGLVSIYDAFLEPLRSGSALMLNKDQMKEKRRTIPGYNVLNRHEIMHGIDKNYGSEVNSLKAIAQLDYLRCIQETLKDHKKWKQQLQAGLSPESQIAIRQTQ